MSQERENSYRYNDIHERYKRMNRFYLFSTDILWLLLVVYLVMKRLSSSIYPIVVYANLILIAGCAVVNSLVYIRNKANGWFKNLVVVEIGIEYFLLGVQTDAEFLNFALIMILVLQIPYFDKKSIRTASAAYVALYTAVVVIRGIKGVNVITNVDSLCKIIAIYLLFFTVSQGGMIAKEFIDHALGFAESQNEKQKGLFEGILGISQTVQVEADKSGSLVDQLVNVTESVASSMREITSATTTTANSIEEQNSMTQTIQVAIGETGERSKQMVEIATDSNRSIQENMRVMEELKVQSVQIAQTNQKVTEAMQRLQNKTREVEEIAGMILNISSQTNLLALNASIESARAGEAGRGFAVVAEEIRQLAEQTRSSTEEITRIVNELNENANEVVETVEGSVEATEQQNQRIFTAAQAFGMLNENMIKLVANIEEMNQQIGGLSDSNNRIVENISQLSAATEEVTASAEQVQEMSEQNLEFAEEVKKVVGHMRQTADDVEKYL